MQWAAATHITSAGEPDLVGFAIWAIFLSLGFFTAFALASWPLSIAPFLALLEERSVFRLLVRACASEGLYQQAGRDQPGHGHRQAVADGAGHGLFRRAAAVRDRTRSRRPAPGMGRFGRRLFLSPTTSSRWCGSRRFLSSGGSSESGQPPIAIPELPCPEAEAAKSTRPEGAATFHQRQNAAATQELL